MQKFDIQYSTFNIKYWRDIFSFFIVFSLILFVLSVGVSSVFAAGSLKLSPVSGNGSQFEVQVIVDTGGEATVETDVLLNYDSSILQVGNVVFGSLYPENVNNIDSSNGILSMFSYFSGTNPEDNFNGTGVLATIQFIGLNPGISGVTIKCVPSATNESNMIRQSLAGDILDCALVVNGSYTVESATATSSPAPTVVLEVLPTATPIPIVVLSPTAMPTVGVEMATPTPVVELLQSGSVASTIVLPLVGAILLMGSLILFIL